MAVISKYKDLLDKVESENKGPGQNQSGDPTGEPLQYPEDLFTGENVPFIIFWRKDAVARDSTVLGRVALYMPPDIKVNYGTQWEEIQMSLMQYYDTAADAFKFARSLTDAGKSGEIGAGLLNQAARIATGNGPARVVARVVDTALNTNFAQQTEVLQKQTLNPHTALLFKGVNLRQFQFDFQLLARSANESGQITKIIKFFKLGMHPQQIDGAQRFWKYPDNFEVQLFTPSQKHLFNISTCTLEDMSVNYAGSGGGIPSFFEETHAPVDVRLSIRFKELTVLDRDKILRDF